MAARRTPLEVFKFALYVSIPIVMVGVVAQPEPMKMVIRNTQYILYPPEDPRGREMMEIKKQEVFDRFNDAQQRKREEKSK